MIKGGIRIGGLGIAGYDADAAAYFDRAGVTDTAAKIQINAFVKGMKNLSLYNDMVCWPLRSSQNKGSGTTAYSLGGLGTYDGTLINGPTWGTDGVNFVTGSVTRIESSTVPFSNSLSVFNVSSHTAFGAPSGDHSATAVINPSYQISGQDSFINGSSGARNLYFWIYRAGGVASELVVSITDDAVFLNSFHAYGVSASSSNNATIYDGTATTLTTSTPVIGSSQVVMGFSSIASRPMTGKIPFHLVSSVGFSASQYSSLYTLYKTTLGTGLGLP